MQLPYSKDLPVNLLAACFNSTSATYKYYWFISILQSIEEGSQRISKRTLFARMISNAWYTVNYFHVSFGKQDLIQDTIELIMETENIKINEKHKKIISYLTSSNNKTTIDLLYHFNKQVPHWFLSPWFPKIENETDTKRENRIYFESKLFSKGCLYALHDDEIIINPDWITYLSKNVRFLKDFCYWNLVLYLQSKNPNVPDIPNKLIKPAVRNGLTKQRKQFWDIVVYELGSIECIYTKKPLTIGNYAVDHFIPYSFVSHDLIWNLIPAYIPFNIHKGDKLPQLDLYFDSFFKLQSTAIDIVKLKSPANPLLEDYLSVFTDLEMSFNKENFLNRIQPLITIASNNGFEFLE